MMRPGWRSVRGLAPSAVTAGFVPASIDRTAIYRESEFVRSRAVRGQVIHLRGLVARIGVLLWRGSGQMSPGAWRSQMSLPDSQQLILTAIENRHAA